MTVLSLVIMLVLLIISHIVYKKKLLNSFMWEIAHKDNTNYPFINIIFKNYNIIKTFLSTGSFKFPNSHKIDNKFKNKNEQKDKYEFNKPKNKNKGSL